MNKIVVAVLAILIGIVIASCGKKGVPYDETPEPVYTIQRVSGNNQQILAGGTLDTLRVRVRDNFNSPVAGVEVQFSPITTVSGGTFPPGNWSTRITNDVGEAYTFYFVDTLVGLDTMQAKISNADDSLVYFAFTVIPRPADSIALVSGDNQSATAGEPLSEQCVVKITDKYGNAISNHRVRFKTFDRCLVATDSSAGYPYFVDTAVTRTDADGLASVQWYLTVNPLSDSYPHFGLTLYAYFNSFTPDAGDSVRFLSTGADPGMLTYYDDIKPIFQQQCISCHGGAVRQGDYALDFYYEVSGNGNMVPGDTNSTLLDYANANHPTVLVDIDKIETDKIIHWVVANDAAPGSSGLLNYTDDIASIFTNHCVSCHGNVAPDGNYDLSSHAGIRGNGTDGTANAIAGDANSLLLQRIGSGGNMRQYLLADSVILADSIATWIVTDSLRQF